jgi:hypothetical protein
MSSTNRLEFGDTGTYINQSGDGILNITSDTEVEINATAVDLNGTLDVSGTLTQGGASQFNSTLTVGADDAGHDVIFYGDTASSNMTWDTSGDDLILNDARLYINQDDDAFAIQIDSEATSVQCIAVGGKMGIYSEQNLSGGYAGYFKRDYDEAGSNACVSIIDDHANNTQPALKVYQDGNAAHIEFAGTGSGGIKFKASATDSADANTLDDYEEGTWSAVVSDGTNAMTMSGSFDTGYYTKVGNLVTVSGHFVTTSLGSASGAIRITGLPFTVANNAAAYSGGGAAYGDGLYITAGHSVSYFTNIGSDAIILYVWDTTGGTTAMQASEWTADGKIMIGFSYRAA